jgi:toxin-antitoxin system PIN domain toxin
MIDLELPDVNVLLALLHPAHAHHRQAQEWFDAVARFATTPITESGFLRTALNPTVVGAPTTAAAALASLKSVREHGRAEFLADDSSLADPGFDLRGLSGFRQVTDFQLVNLAARHSACLVTFDRKIRSSLLPDDQHLVRTLA